MSLLTKKQIHEDVPVIVWGYALLDQDETILENSIRRSRFTLVIYGNKIEFSFNFYNSMCTYNCNTTHTDHFRILLPIAFLILAFPYKSNIYNICPLSHSFLYNNMCTYEGRSFNSGTNAPPSHMAVRNSWKLRLISGWGGGSNNGTKFCLNLFTLSKVIEHAQS